MRETMKGLVVGWLLLRFFPLRCKLLSWVAPNIRGYEFLLSAELVPEKSSCPIIFPGEAVLECAFIRQTHKRPSHEDVEEVSS